MNRRPFFALLALLSGFPGAVIQAEETSDDPHLAFRQALGEESWIASGADHALAETAVRPIPSLDSRPVDSAKRQLGFALFHDRRLSADNTVACNSCHMGMHGGTDNLTLSRGIGGQFGSRNTPTVFNSVFNFRQFWDGRAFNLDEQALEPLINPVEMGHDLQRVVDFVASDPNYARQFQAVYSDGVTAANIGNAIAQHTRDMTRTDSRFNAYLAGDETALNAEELRGWKRFQAVGCTSCHNGINLGGNSYQAAANALDDYAANAPDPGLYARSGREQDRQVFKVPTLHNVALTAPYFHDGSVPSLREAVVNMGERQAGRRLSDADADAIVAFLHTLSSQFFAGRAHNMSQQAIEGEMRQQLHINHEGGHGGMSGSRPGQSPQAMPMNHHGGAMNHSRHHMMMSSPPGDSTQGDQHNLHGGHAQ